MKEGTVLIADDDAGVRRTVTRVVAQTRWEPVAAENGPQALEAAARSTPDMIVLDACMPGMSGFEVCRRLRRDWRLRLIPVLFLTGLDAAESELEGYDAGADAYMPKPFDVRELLARLEALWKRSRQALAAHPLTGLPGSPSLEAEARRRLESGQAVALLHADIDSFKAFNDRYGFARGDQAIRAAARAVQDACGGEGFPAHIGGDDFALLCPEEQAEAVARALCAAFDELAPSLYDADDLTRGGIDSADRRGAIRRYPVTGLSVGVALSSRLTQPVYADLAACASELKAFCKKSRDKGGSRFALERRGAGYSSNL